ncbi:MAG: penicillin-binding protein activator [Gammaproteobacteria bacterium]
MQRAEQASGARAATLILDAVELMLDEEQTARAEDPLQLIERPESLPATLRTRYVITQAQVSLSEGELAGALDWLTGSVVPPVSEMDELAPDYLSMLAETQILAGNHDDAVTALLQLSDYSESQFQDRIWNTLRQLDTDQLQSMAAAATSYELRGWVELARTMRTEQSNMKGQLDAIERWRRTWTRHSAVSAMPTALLELQNFWEQRPRHIALILPLQDAAGIAIQEGFLSAYYETLEITRDVPRITLIDSSGASLVQPLYDQAVAAGADLVIGPLAKPLVNQLREMSELPVSTLALNYADQESPAPQGLYQFGLAPEDEIFQAVTLAWDAGYRNAAVMTPASADYIRLHNIFRQRWTELGGTVVSSSEFSSGSEYAEIIKRLMAIDSSENRAARLLDILPRANMEFTPRRRQDIDFIFLIANPLQGRQIKPTLAFYFAEDIPVYALPSINDGSENPGANRDLDGIVFPDAPWILDHDNPLKQSITQNLRPAQGSLQRLRAMGIDSFRLYPRLLQLDSGHIQTLNGVTGALSMSASGRIQRRLEVARFSEGVARRITTTGD